MCCVLLQLRTWFQVFPNEPKTEFFLLFRALTCGHTIYLDFCCPSLRRIPLSPPYPSFFFLLSMLYLKYFESVSGSARICIGFGRLDPNLDTGGPKWPTKKRKREEIRVLNCWMFSSDALSLDLHWGKKRRCGNSESGENAFSQLPVPVPVHTVRM